MPRLTLRLTCANIHTRPPSLHAAPPPAPCSLPALQSGLERRGFQVMRLNTYDTVPVTTLDGAALAAAKRAAVVTVGSPSAIK